ncbi:MAG TPA: sugar ABC transporter permease [Candidatus Limnocylindrales bacterium]|nr:sugar ABC transporter permease [Candidatus Limnocylindrales bacterium]
MGFEPLGPARDQAALGGTVPAAKPPPAATVAGRRYDRTTLIFLGPPAILLVVLLVYPTIYTIALAFNRGRRGEFTEWVGFDNFVALFKDKSFLNLSTFPPSGAIWNNLLWGVFYTGFVIFLGLVVAVLASRVRYESLIKAVVFLPMAIAATALAIIWNFVYAPDKNIGLLNAIVAPFTNGGLSWLGNTSLVNAALITAGIWGSVGFATVILSAALKSIPSEVLEAGRVDGASERQVFFRIIIPMVSLPISVLAVTLIVNVIKLFDLIYVLTNGGPGTASRVIAFTMYQDSIPGGQFGRGAAIAVIMLVLLVPVMAYNIRRFRSARVT